MRECALTDSVLVEATPAMLLPLSRQPCAQSRAPLTRAPNEADAVPAAATACHGDRPRRSSARRVRRLWAPATSASTPRPPSPGLGRGGPIIQSSSPRLPLAGQPRARPLRSPTPYPSSPRPQRPVAASPRPWLGREAGAVSEPVVDARPDAGARPGARRRRGGSARPGTRRSLAARGAEAEWGAGGGREGGCPAMAEGGGGGGAGRWRGSASEPGGGGGVR